MKRPTQGDDLWELKIHSRVFSVVIGKIEAVRRTKLIVGVTGSIFPVWEVVYSFFSKRRKQKVLRTTWTVKADGRWFTSDGEER